jgi:hypothetical protein
VKGLEAARLNFKSVCLLSRGSFFCASNKYIEAFTLLLLLGAFVGRPHLRFTPFFAATGATSTIDTSSSLSDSMTGTYWHRHHLCRPSPWNHGALRKKKKKKKEQLCSAKIRMESSYNLARLAIQ